MSARPKCDTPGCGRPIPDGGEGHPEICPVCLSAADLYGNRDPCDPCLTRGCAVAVIRRGDRVLLGQRLKNDMAHGMWVFPGGGIEAHEDIAEGLSREVREETGLAVAVGSIIAATRSSARQRGPRNLAVIFWATAADDAEPADSDELKDLAFFTFDEARALNLSPATRVTLEAAAEDLLTSPILIRLACPACHELHVDEGEFATKPHHTHACQYCGNVWRPAIAATVGVRFLPGFKNP